MLGFVIRAFAPRKITYVVDRSMKKSMRIEFDKYAERKAAWLALHDSSMEIRAAFRVEDFKELPELIVRHEDSRKEPCLQVVDYLADRYHVLSGAITRITSSSPESSGKTGR